MRITRSVIEAAAATCCDGLVLRTAMMDVVCKHMGGGFRMVDKVTIDFRELLGFRHVVTLAGENELNASVDRPGETISAMAKAAGAIFNKGGEWATCESQGKSSKPPHRRDAAD